MRGPIARSIARRTGTLLVAGATILTAVAPAACRDDGAADGRALPDVRAEGATIRTSALQAGPETPAPDIRNPYEGDGTALADGRRLYLWMNCHGCHGALGGGGIGPPLADTDWIYGGSDVNIYQSIMQGRPNGMPTFGGKLPEESAWRIAAFVRSLSKGAEAREERGEQGPTDRGALEATRK